MSTKKCNKCQEELPLDCFGIISTRKNKQGDPLTKSRCKKCLAVDQMFYSDDKGESYKEYRQEYEQVWRYHHSEHLEEYENNRNITRREQWKSFMKNKKCNKCGFNDPRALQWHHLDPQNKSFNIGASIYSRKHSWQDIMTEISKCECLCANCHWITHSEIRLSQSS
jgi:predicted Zn-ribbon and HTH transcriptional regulator